MHSVQKNIDAHENIRYQKYTTSLRKENVMKPEKHTCSFIIDSPSGEFSMGVCLTCGKKRTFANAPENALLVKTHKERWNQTGFHRKPKE